MQLRRRSARAARPPRGRGTSSPTSRRAESCSTPRAAAAASSCAISWRCVRIASSSGGSIVKSSRAASAIARSIRTGSSLKPDVGIADRADDAGAQIVEAADVVDDREGRDVVEQRVDREVAAERVFFRRAERVVVMDQMFAFRRASGSGAGHAVLRRLLRPAATWRRNVATSMTFCPNLTCASRKRRPMIQQFRNSFLT